jgi:D-alanine-D-alanine ligase
MTSPKKFHHVAVLMGGLSAEREVSLITGEGVVRTLTTLGYQVTPIDMQRDIAQRLIELKPDAIFNALHGTYGEDGCIQGLLEILNIPYTHSGVMSSAIAMNKDKAIAFFKSIGLSCTTGRLIDRNTLLDILPSLKPPYVIKPVNEGSSVGVNIVLDSSHIPNDIYPSPYFLVEDYIPGKELSVAVIDEEPLGVIELDPKTDFYDYSHKYTAGLTQHYMPARLEKSIYQEAMDMAFKAHHALGCSGVTRTDMRFNPASGKLYILEINTHPGMTPLSLVPEIAAYRNISFEQLIGYLMEKAACGK